MKKVLVAFALFAAIGAQAAPHQEARPARADRLSNRKAASSPAPAAATKKPTQVSTTEESGGCFSCYWRAGLLGPLTFEEEVKFDMCKAKYCY